ncbi:MAG: PstS family phosphate ABC transporter substrate-binding protein [Actinobacteria bacterium]|nr:PstS family phosphate ABC transporter substrate-binding protein [Actinomycetota bacterium]
MRTGTVSVVVLALLLAAANAGCGRDRPAAEPVPTEEVDTGAFEDEELTGSVRADGSSTVAPLVSLAAERFRKKEPGVEVTVGISGTGGGFERFCRGETDLSNASRPIKDEEIAACSKKRIDYLELQVANDGLSVVVNNGNDWARCLTVDQLKKIWAPGSKVKNWREIDPSFPSQKLTLYGAGTDSGTFDYFTDAIVGEEGASRTDYSATEDDNVTVRGVSGAKGALGYFGLSYLESNEGKLKGVEIDGGDGCVAPTVDTVQDGTYKPLSRPLFTYVKTTALEKAAVDTFLAFLLDNQEQLARRALFVPLTDDQLERSRTVLEGASNAVD